MSVEISKSSAWESLASGKQQLLVATGFWAPSCPHCRVFKPVFESSTLKDQDNLFVKVDVDQTQDIISKKYGTLEIPLVKFFSESKEFGKDVGYIPKDNFKNDINKMVTSAPSCLANSSSVKPSANNTIPIIKGREAG